MVNKNTTKKTRKARKNFPLIKLICTISFLVGVILFVINAVTDFERPHPTDVGWGFYGLAPVKPR